MEYWRIPPRRRRRRLHCFVQRNIVQDGIPVLARYVSTLMQSALGETSPVGTVSLSLSVHGLEQQLQRPPQSKPVLGLCPLVCRLARPAAEEV
eukprot:1186795-Amphidinium_carterae.1